jgi:hypothetical protein
MLINPVYLPFAGKSNAVNAKQRKRFPGRPRGIRSIGRWQTAQSVAGVHFFSRIGYYYVPLTGPRMYLMTLLRTAFTVCVPLFLLLSGYLCRRHRPCAGYYGKLGSILTAACLEGIYNLLSGIVVRFHCKKS